MSLRALPAPAPACEALRSQCRSSWTVPPAWRVVQQQQRQRASRCRLRAEAAASGPQEEEGPRDADASPPLGSLERLVELADLNQLQTALNRAIAAENWELAARIRDVLRVLTGNEGRLAADWQGLGLLEWLADRAESLGFTFPTEVQKRAAPVILDGDDCIIQSETGSGKTLAFLLPLLSRLSYPPHTYPDDLQGPAAVVVVPTRELGVQLVMLIYRLFGGSVNQGVPGQGGNMFDYHGPRGLKVKGLLLEGEVAAAKRENYLKGTHVVVGTPDLLAQVLSPPDAVEAVQHVEVVAVDEVDACFQTHPAEMELIMAAACSRQAPGAQQPPLRQQADYEGAAEWEAAFSLQQDAAAQQQQQQQGGKPVVVLVGATLDEPLVEHVVAQAMPARTVGLWMPALYQGKRSALRPFMLRLLSRQWGWVRDPVTVRVGARMHIPSGLQHRCIVVATDADKVAAMCRQIRADLREQSADAAPARVMVFAGSEAQARQLADPLRTVLWGDHKISVLLPEGAEPIKALHSFRDNKTTLLLATPAAARGLDLPAVSHVYNIELPHSPTDYLHRAGRSGRIGSAVQGVVTTLVTEAEMAHLQQMAAALGIDVAVQPPPPPELPAEPDAVESDVEAARRGLEDLFNLY